MKSKMRQLTVYLLLIGSGFTFQNCSKINFNGQSNSDASTQNQTNSNYSGNVGDNSGGDISSINSILNYTQASSFVVNDSSIVQSADGYQLVGIQNGDATQVVQSVDGYVLVVGLNEYLDVDSTDSVFYLSSRQ